MTTKEFAHWLSTIPSISSVFYQEEKVYFLMHDEMTVLNVTTTAEIAKTPLTLHTSGKGIMFCLHGKDLEAFYKCWNAKDTRPKINEKGLPDLSLVTCRQMANELKKRKNLTFALIYTEENNSENITLEGSGDSNKLVGLIARGLNLSIQWADNKTDFSK